METNINTNTTTNINTNTDNNTETIIIKKVNKYESVKSKLKSKTQCSFCNKSYVSLNRLEKHKLICEFKHKTLLKSKKKLIIEEEEVIIDFKSLVLVVQELLIKNMKLEKEVEELQKIIKKKKKIEILQYLNTKIIEPSLSYENMLKNLITKVEHFELLIKENSRISIFDLFITLLEENINVENISEYNYPIRCFDKKKGIFYIYDFNNINNINNKKEQEQEQEQEKKQEPLWKKASQNDIINLYKTLQQKMIGVSFIWKNMNKELMKQNDKLCNSYNKAIIKIMNLTLDTNNNKFKNILFNYLKKELIIENNIEYEFE